MVWTPARHEHEWLSLLCNSASLLMAVLSWKAMMCQARAGICKPAGLTTRFALLECAVVQRRCFHLPV